MLGLQQIWELLMVTVLHYFLHLNLEFGSRRKIISICVYITTERCQNLEYDGKRVTEVYEAISTRSTRIIFISRVAGSTPISN